MATKKTKKIEKAKDKEGEDVKRSAAQKATKVKGSDPVVVDNATPVSQARYARTRVPKLTPQYVNKLVKNGVITLDQNGKIIPYLADKQRAEMADPAREHRRKENTPGNGMAGSVNEGDPDDFSDAKVLAALKDQFTPHEIKLFEAALKKLPNWNGSRRVGEAVKAQNELLEYQEARGLLIESAEVETFWAEKLALVKTKLLSVPRKMAQEVSALVLKYAAEFGRDLVKAITAIKKKKSGKWLYNKKTGAIELYSGKVKKPVAVIGLSMEAPEHAESLVINETETALASEVHAALNELAGQKESD